MTDSKERILRAALGLFARRGYDGVSVGMISEELGLAKSALYKHFKNKRDIFNSILRRMEERDEENARESGVPTEPPESGSAEYMRTEAENIKQFSKKQFQYWTEDSFASDFRRLLTLEQYGSAEMSGLYSMYLSEGPLEYIAELFGASADPVRARRRALEFYAPMYILYGVYDRSTNKEKIKKELYDFIDNFEI